MNKMVLLDFACTSKSKTLLRGQEDSLRWIRVKNGNSDLSKRSKQNRKKKNILNKGNRRLNSKEKLLICCIFFLKKGS